jgi:hypothetical protein
MGAGALGLCLSLAASGAAATPVFVAGEQFTLAWLHSIEKTRWEEDYAVRRERGAVRLHASAARIRGSGAGMEPPPGAVLRDGWYHYRPADPWPAVLRLSRSEFVPDYELCVAGRDCRPLAHWLASDGGATLLTACVRGDRRGAASAPR